MRIDIIFDTICPWCYIGKSYLDRALQDAPDHPFTIRWRPFMLNPDMPADGISSPTRAPGRYKFGLSGLNRLSPGKYSLVVEGSREHGGRELVKVPFRIQRGRASSGSAKGSREVGRVSVSIRP